MNYNFYDKFSSSNLETEIALIKNFVKYFVKQHFLYLWTCHFAI
jgi:hypothetical protein